MGSVKKYGKKLKYADPTYYMTGGGGVVSAATGGDAIGDFGLSSILSPEGQEVDTSFMDEANRVQWAMYQQSRADVAPWREAGAEALEEYQSLMEGGLSGYEMTEAGQKQADYMAELEASAREKYGTWQQEDTPLALASARMGVQQSEYENRLNRLASLSGIGQATGTTMAGLSQSYGAQQTDLLIQQQNIAYAQQAAAQQAKSQQLGALGGIVGGIGGFMVGGPAGAMAGSQLGSGLGSSMGGFL